MTRVFASPQDWLPKEDLQAGVGSVMKDKVLYAIKHCFFTYEEQSMSRDVNQVIEFNFSDVRG